MDNFVSIPTGAYILKPRNSKLVLTEGKTLKNNVQVVTCDTRDDDLKRDRQIWWIEKVPEFGTKKKAPEYKIWNLGSKYQYALELEGSEAATGTRIVAWYLHGGPWQVWRFEKISDNEEDEREYQISNVHNNQYLTTNDTKRPGDYYSMHCEPQNSSMDTQKWSLLPPVTSVPAGYLNLQPAGASSVLYQEHLNHLPSLTTSVPASDARTQWVLIRAESLVPGALAESNLYLIRNRHTGGFLWLRREEGKAPFVCAWHSELNDSQWRLEKTMTEDWRIVESESNLGLKADGTVAKKGGVWQLVKVRDQWTLAYPDVSADPPVYSAPTGPSSPAQQLGTGTWARGTSWRA